MSQVTIRDAMSKVIFPQKSKLGFLTNPANRSVVAFLPAALVRKMDRLK